MRSILLLIRFILFGIVLSCFTNYTYSQTQLSIKNFAVFGGDNTASLTDSTVSGLRFFPNVSVQGGGLVGTQTFIYAQDQLDLDGDVYANNAFFGNNLTVNGSLSIFNVQHTNNFVYKRVALRATRR